MDLKVYKKEEVLEPTGLEQNIIDIYPEIDESTNTLKNATILSTYRDTIEQACLLATIWQKGLDPLDLEVGVRWAEAILEEINLVQLMEDITNAIAEITPTVEVVFDTITDKNGNTILQYTLRAVA